MRDANPKTTYLKDYQPPDFLIETVELKFSLQEENTQVVSRMHVVKNPDTVNSSGDLELTGEDVLIDSVRLDGRLIDVDAYRMGDNTLVILNTAKAKSFVVEITTRINPKTNTALEGLYLSNGMFCTQCEAEGFRKITYFPDRPDIMARFSTTIIADKTRYPVLLSNGNPVSRGEFENNQHWVKWEDPFKKPCYLFALVAGHLECLEDTYLTCSRRTIDLKIYVEKQDIDKCGHAMASLKKAMQWDEEVYGREYDLDLYMIVAVSHFNMGAMENKGLNVFNSKYVLARPDTATDADYESIEAVIGHEYFHNWTGNRITLRDWFQLSLKEGLTVFRDQEFTADQTSRGVKRINDVNMLRTRQFAEDAGPMAHPVRPDSYMEINNFYTLTVYEKGAEVVRMIHTLVGPDGFRKGTDLYFQRHDGQAVTTDDFVKAIEDANKIDLQQFQRWYTQGGTPEVRVSSEYDPESKSLILNFNQSCPPTPGQSDKQPLHIPIALGLLAEDGSELPVHIDGYENTGAENVLEIKESSQRIRLIDLDRKPVISILRGFSAPVKLSMDQSTEELAFLLTYDSDPFNRWEAGQQLASRIILELVERNRQGETNTDFDHTILEAYRHILSGEWEDLCYLSLLLTLPSESYLGEKMELVDVENIFKARQAVKSTIASTFHNNFLEIYQNLQGDESGQLDPAAVGRRTLKNTCLDYLKELENEDSYKLSQRQLETANTMTDQIAALSAIINSHHPAKPQCLESFYQQWEAESLVIDKWFAIQSMSSMPGTFDTVKTLRQHPAFDINNPNRTRSLIGAFSQQNPLHFHQKDGAGYAFLADHVIELNATNPQVAARMLGAFTHWRRYDENRQRSMQEQLQRIIGTEGISRDVFEIASKSLVPQTLKNP